MFFGKVGLLTCAFYVGFTILLDVVLWGVIQIRGQLVGPFVPAKHWGLSFGLRFGAIYGFLWLVSFSAAWYITYSSLKSVFPPAIH